MSSSSTIKPDELEEAVQTRLAPINLELHLLTQRWEMQRRMINDMLEERQHIIEELRAYGLLLTQNGDIEEEDGAGE